jgi:DnaJ-class molecular chaperone
MTNLPDYYFILDVPVTATHEEIREGKAKKEKFYARQAIFIYSPSI